MRPEPAPVRWLRRRGGWARAAVAVLAGALMTAAQPPLSQPWVLLAALPLVVWLVDAAPGRAFLTGWAVAFGYFTSGLYWIGHAFLVDAARFAWMMPFAVTALPAFLGLFWGGAFWAAARRWPAGWTRVLVLAGWLTLIEYARAHVLTGFPWALPAYAWIGTPVAQALAWAGPFGLTLATLALAALPAVGLAGRGAGGRTAAAVALALLAGLWLAGAERLAEPQAAAPRAPVLRVVQPNAVQKLKWHPDWAPVFYRRLLDESAAPAAPELGPPDAVVWPETAVPFLPAEAPERLAEIAAAGQGAPVLLGALARPGGGARLSNSLMVVAEGRIVARYDKHHLVPFGEYLPYPWLFARLGFDKLVPGAGFEPGPGPRVLEAPGLPPFSPLVCYEMIFADEVVPEGARPGWLLQVTNDAWFGGWGGPQQHLAQARARAIEQGLPVVRAANTGISAHIDAHGRLRQTLGLDRHGRLDFRLSPPMPPTPYALVGDWPALVLALVLCVFPLMRKVVTVE